jgi:C-terminal processing protease CtpA/Prc
MLQATPGCAFLFFVAQRPGAPEHGVRRMRVESMKAKSITIGVVALALTVFAGEFGGIGLVIVDRKNSSEPLRTGSAYPGSPAERAGVTTNGLLISVDGTNVVSMSLTQSMSIVRGPVGSFVILEIADAKMSRTNRFTVKRSKMVFSGQKIEFIDPQ